MYCPQCGHQIDDDAAYCSNCGMQLKLSKGRETQDAQPEAAQPAAAQPTINGTASFQPAEEEKPHRKVPAAAIIAGVACIAVALVVAASCLGLFGDSGLLGLLPSGGSDTGASTSTSQQSSTPKQVSVPTVSGMAQADAVTKLTDAGLVVGTITTQESDETEGTVLSQSVAGSAEEGTKVDLVVAKKAKKKVFTIVHECMTREDAEAYCEAQGGTLACIASQDEWNQVVSMLEADGHSVYWLGGYRSGDSWCWADGSTFSFTDWASGEPNNDQGIENYMAAMLVDGTIKMYDEPNDVSSYYKSSMINFVMQTYE